MTADVSKIEHLGFLGIISSIIEETNLVKIVDDKLPVSKAKGAIVSNGQRVAAMILNGLGFLNDRLYMHEQFFGDKPINKLLGSNITAANLNDDVLGSCLDAIHQYGTTKFYSEIVFKIANDKKLLGKYSRIDTTSLSVTGDYENQPDDCFAKDNKMEVNHGYSKQKRFDLKQVVLSLTVNGPADLPLWVEGLSGNKSDKKSLRETAAKIENFKKNLKESPDFIYVADSALYNKELLKCSGMRWLSRVPESIKEAKKIVVSKYCKSDWTATQDNYSIINLSSNYGDILQRWQLVYSKQAYKRESATLKKNLNKDFEDIQTSIVKIEKRKFKSKAELEQAINTLSKKYKFHTISFTVDTLKKHLKKGKPSKTAVPTIVVGYSAKCQYKLNRAAVVSSHRKCGRFILATNELNEEELPSADILLEYKKQSKVEKGFRFIKNNEFMLSSIYLKKASRIEALLAIMTLSLMVYNFGQHKLRSALAENKDTLPNQVKKQTDRPTLRWVFRILNKIAIATVIDYTTNSIKEVVANVCDVCKKIIRYFGKNAMCIYGVT